MKQFDAAIPRAAWLAVGAAAVTFSSASVFAQGTENGQWLTLGGDFEHTRYSPADQITPDNFEDLEEEWVWDGAIGYSRVNLLAADLPA